MKRIMRILGTIIISAALFISPISALADEIPMDAVATEADVVLHTEDCNEIVGENIDEGKDAENDDLAYEENNGADDEKNAYDVYEENVGAETEENGFEKIYEAIMKHISEILSLAAFIGSLICAVIYKSGLMPLIEKGLGGVKNAAQKIKEATDRAECDNKASINYIGERMNELELAISELKETLTEATIAMDSSRETTSHCQRIDSLLAGELDMLYDIFMSSALPEYEKARVGERVSKLKEELRSNENEK